MSALKAFSVAFLRSLRCVSLPSKQTFNPKGSVNVGLYHEDYLALKARNGGAGTKAVCTLARKLVPLLLNRTRPGVAA